LKILDYGCEFGIARMKRLEM